MYDEQTRNKALSLLVQGYSPRKASELMGGRPGYAIILQWAAGYVPQGKRRTAQLYSLEEKLEALDRVKQGEPYKHVAEELGCVPSTILTWRRIYNRDGADGLRTRLDNRTH